MVCVSINYRVIKTDYDLCWTIMACTRFKILGCSSVVSLIVYTEYSTIHGIYVHQTFCVITGEADVACYTTVATMEQDTVPHTRKLTYVKVKYPLISIATNTDHTMPGCSNHLRFHGLEPTVGMHLALWVVDHTTSTTCHYLSGFYKLEAIQRWSAICCVWSWTLTYQKFLLCISSQGQDLYTHQKLNMYIYWFSYESGYSRWWRRQCRTQCTITRATYHQLHCLVTEAHECKHLDQVITRQCGGLDWTCILEPEVQSPTARLPSER